LIATRDDPELMRTVIDVFHLLEPPSTLFGPMAIARRAGGCPREIGVDDRQRPSLSRISGARILPDAVAH
jgi:hypothetical protein